MSTMKRRTVLSAAASGVFLSGCALAGCANKDLSKPRKAQSAAAGTEIGKATDIPVGGGKVFAEHKLVVTQPSEGQFKAYSAICTHQGCLVSSVAEEKIHCSCHGSDFAITDGSVVGGPASRPLPAVAVADDNGTLVFA